MKKLVSIIVIAVMCLALSMTAFAAEIDLAEIGGVQNYNLHGYPGVDAIMFGYGSKVALGEYNLADYDSIIITYATDMGFVAEKEDMPVCAFFAICDADVNVGYANTGVQNEANILAKADVEDASVVNEAGTNWGRGERTVEIDVSELTYSGALYLSHYNSTGNEALVVGIEFVEADAEPSEPSEPSTPSNPESGDASVIFVVVAAALVLTVVAKKKIFA